MEVLPGPLLSCLGLEGKKQGKSCEGLDKSESLRWDLPLRTPGPGAGCAYTLGGQLLLTL